jgi:trehalose 6-phosphate phosphatase
MTDTTHTPMTDTTDASDASDAELPPALRENLYVLVEQLVASDGLFVALDFDGTLAAIEREPDEAAIPDATREAIVRLATEPNVEVAVVSGRELADVRERVGLPELSYAGNHGLEIHTDEYVVHPEARRAEAAVAEACERLEDRLTDVEGAIVENKGVSATVHSRLVADGAVPAVREAVESAVADDDDLRLTTGKDVLEIRPAVEWDKGAAVRQLTDELVPDSETWLPVYVGDDTTDEAAFAVLEAHGIAVKVGEDPDTRAAYRVADPEGVRAVLSWLDEFGLEFLTRDGDDLLAGEVPDEASDDFSDDDSSRGHRDHPANDGSDSGDGDGSLS